MIKESEDAFVKAVIAANQEIYQLCQSGEVSLFAPLQRGEGGDMTHGIDQRAEEIFIRHLLPFGMIYSEESGVIGEGKKRIVLDPLDGSDNFLSKIPYYGTSVALESEEGVETAIVTNLCNATVRIKTKSRLQEASLFSLSFRDIVKNPYAKVGIFERAYLSAYYANRLKHAKIKYRSLGAMALSLSLAYEVSFIILEGALRPYDVMAGLFICEDLPQHKTNDLTIICQDERLLNRLKQILLEEE